MSCRINNCYYPYDNIIIIIIIIVTVDAGVVVPCIILLKFTFFGSLSKDNFVDIQYLLT